LRNRLLVALTAVLTGLVTVLGITLVSPANASTGGTLDGAQHPNVGMIAFYEPDGRFRCSATLVSPTVLITAAHCTDGDLGKVAVTFKSVVAEAPPSPLPAAANPAAGYTAAELAAAGFLSGTAYTHPQYSDFTDMANWNDVGVVVLDQPVTDIAPAPIAGVGTLDAIPTSKLRKTLFTAVGYGTEVRQADVGSQKPTPMSYPIVRRYVDMPGQKLTPQILQTNGNENDPFGTGGTCFGDSGGPLFLKGKIVGVTSYGYTQNCRYIDGYQRVDIAAARNWRAGFGL
jgi:hypothetical protein